MRVAPPSQAQNGPMPSQPQQPIQPMQPMQPQPMQPQPMQPQPMSQPMQQPAAGQAVGFEEYLPHCLWHITGQSIHQFIHCSEVCTSLGNISLLKVMDHVIEALKIVDFAMQHPLENFYVKPDARSPTRKPLWVLAQQLGISRNHQLAEDSNHGRASIPKAWLRQWHKWVLMRRAVVVGLGSDAIFDPLAIHQDLAFDQFSFTETKIQTCFPNDSPWSSTSWKRITWCQVVAGAAMSQAFPPFSVVFAWKNEGKISLVKTNDPKVELPSQTDYHCWFFSLRDHYFWPMAGRSRSRVLHMKVVHWKWVSHFMASEHGYTI